MLFFVQTRSNTFSSERLCAAEVLVAIGTIAHRNRMSAMIPRNLCPYNSSEFRAAPAPPVPLPPNHVLLYCLCPCGAHRTPFTVHRNVLLHQVLRSQPIMQNIRAQAHLQRIAEIQLQARIRRYANRKDYETMQRNNDQEEDIDR